MKRLGMVRVIRVLMRVVVGGVRIRFRLGRGKTVVPLVLVVFVSIMKMVRGFVVSILVCRRRGIVRARVPLVECCRSFWRVWRVLWVRRGVWLIRKCFSWRSCFVGIVTFLVRKRRPVRSGGVRNWNSIMRYGGRLGFTRREYRLRRMVRLVMWSRVFML